MNGEKVWQGQGTSRGTDRMTDDEVLKGIG